jgi:outer membrane lipoprotein carrier protein
MFRILTSLLLATTLGFSMTPVEIARNFKKKLVSIESLQSQFEHAYYSNSLAEPLKEKGKFTFKKPDRMRWEYTDPEKKTYVYQAGTILEYVPEENQLVRSTIEKEQAESDILGLFSGQVELEERYQIEESPFPSDDPSAWQIKLTPNEEGEQSYILLEINRTSWLLQKVVLIDWAGNKQEFRFSRIRINPGLPADAFEIKVPPDCEIIDQTTPIKKKNGSDAGGGASKPFSPSSV